jgi:hypothetical protein
MTTLTMCTGSGCSLRRKCYRHLAIPDRLQSYFAMPPWVEDKCEKFLPVYPRDVVREQT